MNVRYDLDLVEDSVILATTSYRKNIHPFQIRRFQFEREKIYLVLDADERNAAFYNLYLKWFRELDLETSLKKILDEFKILSDALQILAFRKARTKNEEAAELYVEPTGKRNGVIALRPEQFKDEKQLSCFLRHELMHLNDMVCPEFGYTRDQSIQYQDPSQQRLTRDRYRLLWDICIDGRLTRSNHKTLATQEQRWLEFDRTYHFWTEDKRKKVFNSLWTNHFPKHEYLLEYAIDPRETRKQFKPFPGALCPLCSFPTFDWVDISRLTPKIIQVIHQHFPNWQLSFGICNRCTEIYETSQMEYPSTLCL